MVDKSALKSNKCVLNIENDIKMKKNNNNNQTIKNDVNVKSVSESRYFFTQYITNISIIKLGNK